MIRFDDHARVLWAGVRDLVEEPHGLANTDSGTGAASQSALGRRLHARWQRDRSEQEQDFRAEARLEQVLEVEGWECHVTGRADGLVPEGEALVVEEVKTCLLGRERLESVAADDLPAAVEQIRIYLYLLQRRGERAVAGRLVLLSRGDGCRRVLHVAPDPATGRRVRARLSHRVRRREDFLRHREGLRGCAVPFAHARYRPGQQEMVRAVREALRHGRHLLLSAPTGTGKTAAVVQGALEVARDHDARLFLATARTTQQRMAMDTLRAVREAGLPVRCLLLRARESLCPRGVRNCDPTTCPLRRHHPRRVREGEHDLEVLRHGFLDAERLQAEASHRAFCPHRLALDLLEGVDAVVGDYNYVFHPQVALSRWFGENTTEPERWIVVVDEAHQLPDRLRQACSPSIGTDQVAAARRALSATESRRTRAFLDEVEERLLDLASGAEARGGAVPVPDASWTDHLRHLDAVLMDRALAIRPSGDRAGGEGARGRGDGSEAARVTAGDALPPGGPDPLLGFAWAYRRFLRVMADPDPSMLLVADATDPPEGAAPAPVRVRLFCRDPSTWMAPRMAVLAGSVLMSATLEPMAFHRDLLGIPEAEARYHRASHSFPPENLQVVVAPVVSTRHRHRWRDQAATAQVVQQVVSSVPGNVAVLFSSFAMRQRVVVGLHWPHREVLWQERSMAEAERDRILGVLRHGEGGRPCVLLGVLGGIFAEGIDLPGDALRAVVVVGPGLPPVTLEQKLLQGWYQERWGRGFHLAFVVPGMTRVVQAAGRVVRSASDTGVVVLVGERFVQRAYEELFPPEWTRGHTIRSRDPAEAVAGFFHRGSGGAAGVSEQEHPAAVTAGPGASEVAT